MTGNEATAKVIDILEEMGIPYMLVGSFSSNAYGVARSTHDADFVIELGDQTVRAIADRLGPDRVRAHLAHSLQASAQARPQKLLVVVHCSPLMPQFLPRKGYRRIVVARRRLVKGVGTVTTLLMPETARARSRRRFRSMVTQPTGRTLPQ